MNEGDLKFLDKIPGTVEILLGFTWKTTDEITSYADPGNRFHEKPDPFGKLVS